MAGCAVRSGKVIRGEKVRVLRKGEVIHSGDVVSLKRFKEDVAEVLTGFECGVGISDVQDLAEGDELVIYSVEEVAAKLS